jgi:hypothetical protein
MYGSRSKAPIKKSLPYIYDVKFLALLGAPYLYDISRLRVKVVGKSFLSNAVDDTPIKACRNTSCLFLQASVFIVIDPLTPTDLKRRHAVGTLKIKIPGKKSRQAALRGGI